MAVTFWAGDIKLFRVNGIYVWDIGVSHTNRTRFNEAIRFLRFIYYFPALKKILAAHFTLEQQL